MKTPKFTVSVIDAEGDGFRLQVENRAGRRWVYMGEWYACPGNAGEDAMLTGEYLAGGEKLTNPDKWIEVQKSHADEAKRRAYLESVG